MSIIILYLLFPFILINGQYRYDCSDTFCSSKECSQKECNVGQRLVKNASPCGCCHLCVEQLKEGEKCDTLAAIPKKECGPRLQCEKERCVPAKSKCIRDLADYEQNAQNTKFKPDCDEFGFYKPVQCIPDIMCFCVNKDGKRIFGTDVASRNETMKCDCSREYEEFPREVARGDFLRCMSNGNYDDLQCTEKWCYCMGNSYSIVGSAIEANIKNLLCYDEKRHAMLRGNCWKERESYQIAEHENNGITVIGVDLPDCDLDGSYTPVKCEKGSCYCVKKNGEQYGRTKYKRNHTNVMEYCRCLRDAEMLYSSRNEKKVREFLEKNTCEFKEDQVYKLK